MIDLHQISQLIVPVARAAEEAGAEGGSAVSVLGLNAKIFIAQLVNFSVILFVLWKWVFTPVAKRLQDRTEKIEKSLNDVDRINKEKQDFERWKNEEMSKARKESGAVITQSQSEALKIKEQIANETKQQQAQLVEQAKQQIQQEKTQALQSAKAELADIVTQAAEKILREKLTTDKDQKLIKDSLTNLTK